MNATRFDAITKAWTRLPRRQVLGGLTAGTLGTLLGLGGREASAQSCRRSSDCQTGQACVHRTCTPTCGDPFKVVNGFCVGGTGCPATCFCAKKPGGGGVCLLAGGICSSDQSCKKQRHCPTDQICGSGCCPSPKFTCQPPCVP